LHALKQRVQAFRLGLSKVLRLPIWLKRDTHTNITLVDRLCKHYRQRHPESKDFARASQADRQTGRLLNSDTH